MCIVKSPVRSGHSVYPTPITTNVANSVMPKVESKSSSEVGRRVPYGFVGMCGVVMIEMFSCGCSSGRSDAHAPHES